MSDNPIDSQHEKAVDSLVNDEALMMWLVNRKEVQESVSAGVRHFESKYGLDPNIVILHPDDAKIQEGETFEVYNDLMVATAPWCLIGHALIGIISSADSVWGVSL